MNKQDKTFSRTPSDTERKFITNLGKKFAEIMGIATDARTTAENTKSELSKSVARIDKELFDKGAKIELVVESGVIDENGKVRASIIISAINDQSEAKITANNIVFEGQKLNIKVDNTHIDGKLTAEVLNINDIKAENVDISGSVKATSGEIGGCSIENGVLKIKNVNIGEKLTSEQINANGIKAENVNITGTINANNGKVGDWVLGETEIPYLHLDGTEHTMASQSALYSGEQRYEHDNGFNIYENWLTAKGVYVKTRHYSCGVIINDVYYDELLTGTHYYFDRWGDILQSVGSEASSSSETWTFTLENGTTVNKSICIK